MRMKIFKGGSLNMTTLSVATKAKISERFDFPCLVAMPSQSHYHLDYDLDLYLPADFDMNNTAEKRVIKDFWRDFKTVPQKYRGHLELKEMKKFDKECGMYRMSDMTLTQNVHGSFITIRLVGVRKYTPVYNYLHELFPDLQVKTTREMSGLPKKERFF